MTISSILLFTTSERFKDEAKLTAKEQVYECYTESNQNMKKAGQVLKLFTDDSIPPTHPFRIFRIEPLLFWNVKTWRSIADQIVTNTKFDETAFQWEHIDQLAQSI